MTSLNSLFDRYFPIFHKSAIFLLPFLLFFGTSCNSYKQFRHISEEFEVPSKVFNVDYNQTWQAVKNVMQRYELEVEKPKSGVIKTRWHDNTNEVNFADSFDGNNNVKSARVKIIVNVTKGFRYSREVSKVTIYKRQIVETDFLQGWKEVPSDIILEKTLLYRIGRELTIDRRLKILEEKKNKEFAEQI